ncbi:hypothetical protein BT69DRAFT_1324202 [Atractiella rhizophila]|nr:hypothetical protein BT69DRAFT_1324202 [Atractiella rhizophila]
MKSTASFALLPWLIVQVAAKAQLLWFSGDNCTGSVSSVQGLPAGTCVNAPEGSWRSYHTYFAKKQTPQLSTGNCSPLSLRGPWVIPQKNTGKDWNAFKPKLKQSCGTDQAIHISMTGLKGFAVLR